MVLVGLISTGCSRCSQAIQEKALRQYSREMCGTITHQSGNSCRSEVERRFPQCSRPFLANEVSSERYAECLGFVVARAPSGGSTTRDGPAAP
jgi:hypothetical protein